jgi:MoxR-like ATPase
VDHLSFRIAELGNAEVRADPSLRPILVLTSNSEKNLPDAFLRRCVFYNIPLPGTDRLIEIVRARVAALGGRTPTAAGRGDGPGVAAEPLVGSAVQLFQEIRSAGLRKPPSTAELLNWVQTLIARGAVVSQPVAAIGQTLLSTTCVLAKTRDDADSLERFMKKKFNF